MLRFGKLNNSVFSHSLALRIKRTIFNSMEDLYCDPKRPLYDKYGIYMEFILPLYQEMEQANSNPQSSYFKHLTKNIFACEINQEINSDQIIKKQKLPIQAKPPMHIEDFSEHIIEEVEKNIKKSTSKIYFQFKGDRFLQQCNGFLVRLVHINTLKKNSENQALIGSLKKDKKYLLSCAQINHAINFNDTRLFGSFKKTCEEYETEFTKIVNNSKLFQMRKDGYHKVIITPRSDVKQSERLGVQIVEVKNVRLSQLSIDNMFQNSLWHINQVLDCQAQKIKNKQE